MLDASLRHDPPSLINIAGGICAKAGSSNSEENLGSQEKLSKEAKYRTSSESRVRYCSTVAGVEFVCSPQVCVGFF